MRRFTLFPVSIRTLTFVAALFLALPPALAAESAKPEVVVVYWASKDCRWCHWWESPISGMERRFRSSPEFRQIQYRVVRNERLAEPYTPENFPPDVLWVYERLEKGDKPRFRPAWAVYVGRERVAMFYGTKNWDEETMPQLKALIAAHAGK